MADEILQRDQNRVTVLGGVTDDADTDIQMLRVHPITKRLLIAADFSGVAVTSINGLTGAVTISAGSNITLNQVGQDIEISSTASGSGDVNATTTLTNNAIVLGAGTTDVKVVAGIVTDGASQISMGVNGTASGKLNLLGSTSGTVTITPAAAAGTWVLTLPTTDGNANQFLQTDGSGVTTWATGGTGDFVGPASSTDNAVVRFDGTTGKLGQNSVLIVDDVGNASGFASVTTSTLVLSSAFRLNFANDTTAGANVTLSFPNTTGKRLTGALTSVDMMGAGFAWHTQLWINATGADFTINHDTGATAANRFFCPGNVAYTVKNQATLWVTYDSTSSRWRINGI